MMTLVSRYEQTSLVHVCIKISQTIGSDEQRELPNNNINIMPNQIRVLFTSLALSRRYCFDKKYGWSQGVLYIEL